MNILKTSSLFYLTIFFFFSTLIISCNKKSKDDNTEIISKTQKLQNTNQSFVQNTNYLIADSLLGLKAGKAAIPYLEEALETYKGDSNNIGIVSTLNKLGLAYISLGEYSLSLPYSKRASELAQNHFGEKDTLLADAYYQMGLFYDHAYKADSALEFQDKALRIRHAVYGNMHKKLAYSYLAIGDIYNWVLYDAYNASENYQAALKILEPLKLYEKEKLIQCYYNLATCNWEMHELEKALSFCNEILNNLDGTIPNSSIIKERVYTVVANIFNSKYDYTKAIEYYQQAIKLNQSNYKEPNKYLAKYYINIGLFYEILNEFDISIKYCRMAENISEELKDYISLSDAYQYLSNNYRKLGQYDTALTYLFNCIQLRKDYYSEKHPEISKIYLKISQLYEDLNNHESSYLYLQKAIIAGTNGFVFKNSFSLPSLNSIGNNYYLFKALSDFADLQVYYYHRTSEVEYLKYAMDLYNLSDSLISLSRNYSDEDVTKLSLAEENYKIYENSIETAYNLYEQLKDTKYLQYYFKFIEKNRARLLFENVIRNELISKSMIPDSLRSKEKRLKYQLEYYQDQLSKQDIQNDSVTIRDLNNKIFQLYREKEKVNELLKDNFPEYFQLTHELGKNSLNDLKKKIQNSIIIEYFSGKDYIYAIKIENDSVNIFKIQKDDTYTERISKIIELLHRPNISSYSEFKDFTMHSHYIYKMIVEPLLEKENNKHRNSMPELIIIPDGELSYLPFEILITKQPELKSIDYKNLNYLIKQYIISYAFSSQFVKLSNTTNRNGKINKVLAFAYSNTNSFNDTPLKKITNKKNTEIKGSGNEVDAIMHIMKSKCYIGKDATETNFKNNAPYFDILHLAVHGKSDTSKTYKSCLQFYNSSDNINDGYLYPYELYNTPLTAELAVLSACETGLGKMQKSEGLISIGWGFRYAGCKSLILSLWKANDHSTSIIMRYFYKYLSKGQKINDSLYRSKLQFLKDADGYFAHPTNWATFIVYGNITPINITNRKPLLWITVFVLTGILILILTSKKNKKNTK